MKAVLQIGDWVKYGSTYIKIESATKKKIGYHKEAGESRMHYVRLCEVEPIPLTAEILEKNGFALLQGSWWYKDFHISLITTRNLTLICGRTIQFEYVHQLQQAMRICGITKSIEV